MARLLGSTDVKMNKAVGMKNHFTSNGGGKRPVKPFKRQEFWKCIGCIFSYFNTSALGGGEGGFCVIHVLQL